ncbi:copper chaperone PCu(A)C [Rhodobacterales bacterium]|nr:copper chaperone PCu(A)C [Rhodobacterales bacterium]
MTQAAPAIMAMNAFSPASAPGIGTASAYMMLENASGSQADLVDVSSPAFNMVHLHKSSMSNGVMTMAPVAQLTIPAGGKVMFEPGGLHVMLMGPKAPLKPGDSFPLVLSFASGSELEIAVPVTKAGEMPDMSHDHSSMKMN